MTIYISSHKQFIPYKKIPSSYKIIYLGSDAERLNEDDNKYCKSVTDQTGDNISSKNPFFSELTALYWIWKNDRSPVKGLVHYRRFLLSPSKSGVLLTDPEIETILSTYDYIVPKKYPLFETVYHHYYRHHEIKDLELTRQVIAQLHPEFLDAFDEEMKLHSFYPYNILVARSQKFDAYCEWLFSILFTLEKVVDYSARTTYQARIFGFLSERLFGVWLKEKKSKVLELDTFLPEQTRKQKISQQLGTMVNRFYKES